MENGATKRKLDEIEESPQNDLLIECSEYQTEGLFIDSTKQKLDNVDLEVQNLLLDCSLEVCKKLKEKEEYASSTNINCLPDEPLIRIFEYLQYPDFMRCRRVCRRWYGITIRNYFFKRATLFIMRARNGCGPTIPEILFQRLKTIPTLGLTYLDLSFPTNMPFRINFCDFSKLIRECLPNLYTLMLHDSSFDVCGENLDIAIQMPKNTRVLILHSCIFLAGKRLKDIDCDIPKIHVLDLSCCRYLHIRPASFLLMPYLKKLHLAQCMTTLNFNFIYLFESVFSDFELLPDMNIQDYYFASVAKVLGNQLETLDLELTMIDSITFRTICTSCVFLTELFICCTPIKDKHLILSEPENVLPNLKTLCLRNCQVTVKGVSAFLKVCPSLNFVYVSEEAENPADGFSQCNLPKVRVLKGYKRCNHFLSECDRYRKVFFRSNVVVSKDTDK